MIKLPRRVQFYIVFIILLAFLIALKMMQIYTIPNYYELLLFVFLSVIVESLAIPLANGGAVSVSSAISLSAIIITGPLGASICYSLGLMLSRVKYSSKESRHIFNTPIHRTLFNGAQGFISIGLAGIVYYSFNTLIGDPNFYTKVIPLIMTIIVYLFINITIVTGILSLLNKQSFTNMFIANFRWTLPNLFVISTLGVFVSILYINYGTGVMLFF
jgi:hypothetical protein